MNGVTAPYVGVAGLLIIIKHCMHRVIEILQVWLILNAFTVMTMVSSTSC